MKIAKLCVVCVVEAGVVQQAVDGVEGHATVPLLTLLQLHTVGPEDP